MVALSTRLTRNIICILATGSSRVNEPIFYPAMPHTVTLRFVRIMCHGIYSIQLAGDASETAEEWKLTNYGCISAVVLPLAIISWARKNCANGSGGRMT